MKPVILREHLNGEGKKCRTPNEYHLYNGCYLAGPARKRNPSVFKDLVVPNNATMSYTFCETTDIHNQVTAKNDDWNISSEFMANARVVSAIEKVENLNITRKICMQNRTTNEVVLITIVNFIPTEDYVLSKADGWYIYRADMIAPCLFWNDIKKRL